MILRRDLLALGYTDRAIRRALGRDLCSVRHGAYAAQSTWGELDDAGRHGLRARAVLRQARTEAVLSHVSALVEWDAPTWGFDLTEVHVTRSDRRSGRGEAGVRQHRGQLTEADVVERNGVQVTSPARTALDVAGMGNVERSLCVVNYLLHAGVVTSDELQRRYESPVEGAKAGMVQWPGSLTSNLVLHLADGRVESVGESRLRYLMWRQGVPTPVPQFEVRDADGTLIARLDFAWPEFGVFLEFDGEMKYRDAPVETLRRERRRENRIVELTGWRCIRLTWADLATPERTAARIKRVLEVQKSA